MRKCLFFESTWPGVFPEKALDHFYSQKNQTNQPAPTPFIGLHVSLILPQPYVARKELNSEIVRYKLKSPLNNDVSDSHHC